MHHQSQRHFYNPAISMLRVSLINSVLTCPTGAGPGQVRKNLHQPAARPRPRGHLLNHHLWWSLGKEPSRTAIELMYLTEVQIERGLTSEVMRGTRYAVGKGNKEEHTTRSTRRRWYVYISCPVE